MMQSCYYPTVVSDTKTDKQSSNCRLDGIRSNADQILPAYMQISVNHAASGSSYVELHGTKVVCSVYGPRNDPRSQKEFQEKGKFLCDVRFAPFCSAPTRPQRGQDPQEAELSQMLTKALTPSIDLSKLPKCIVSCYVVILDSDGSELSASIMSASLALADAAIEMRDLVTACSAGILNDTVIVDPTKAETEQGRSEFTVAYMPNLQETTLVSQNGKITHAQLEEAMDISIKACSDILKLVMKTALVQSE